MNTVRSVACAVMAAAGCWMFWPEAAHAQSYNYVDTADLESAPQLFWAKGIVFRDVLVERPAGKKREIDGRNTVRFESERLGEVYAEESALPQFETLEPGTDYYFAGTVAQRGRRYYTIVNNVSPYTNDAEHLKAVLTSLNRQDTTNQYNQIFLVLEQIMQNVHDEVFGYATTIGVPLSDVLGLPQHRQAVASAVRTALRRFEDRNRTASQELFISTIISMMAMQYGYADTTTPGRYEPVAEESLAVEPVQEPEPVTESTPYQGMSEEEWDLTAPIEPEPAVEPEQQPEVEEPAAPAFRIPDEEWSSEWDPLNVPVFAPEVEEMTEPEPAVIVEAVPAVVEESEPMAVPEETPVPVMPATEPAVITVNEEPVVEQVEPEAAPAIEPEPDLSTEPEAAPASQGAIDYSRPVRLR